MHMHNRHAPCEDEMNTQEHSIDETSETQTPISLPCVSAAFVDSSMIFFDDETLWKEMLELPNILPSPLFTEPTIGTNLPLHQPCTAMTNSSDQPFIDNVEQVSQTLSPHGNAPTEHRPSNLPVHLLIEQDKSAKSMTYTNSSSSITTMSSVEDQSDLLNCTSAPTVNGSTPDLSRFASSSSMSRWANWENLQQAVKVSDLPNANALEERRQRNRDSMQRSRQRQRERLERLRTTVEQLEKRYNEMRLDIIHSSQNDSIVTRDTNIDKGSGGEHVIEQRKRLVAENLYLENAIPRYSLWKEQLQNILRSMSYCQKNDPSDLDLSMNRGIMEECEATSVFRFRPLRDEDVKDRILGHTHEIRKIYNRLVNADSKSLFGHLHMLGWDVRRRLNGNEMEFLLTKRFSNKVSVYEMMENTWNCDLGLESFRKIDTDTRKLDILQRINSNAVVFGRDTRSHDDRRVFRTVLLEYKMETTAEVVSPSYPTGPKLIANGYWIGVHSMNPEAPSYAIPMGLKDNERLEWADIHMAKEFLNVKDPTTGETYVEARYTGKTNYKSTSHAYRNTVDTLTAILRWELTVVSPALNLVSLSLDDSTSAILDAIR